MNQYTLTVTEKQARLIAQALDLASRLQMGQWPSFIEWLPNQSKFVFNNLREKLQPTMTEHFQETVSDGCPYVINGWTSYYSVYNESVPDTARVAWDLQKVIQHRLAWDRNPEGGFTVDFDKPAHAGKEPLATIVRVGKENEHSN